MVTLKSETVENLPIPSFYAGKSIFITGGTGFVGKVFIERFLYTCPDIDKIYMLVREKKGLSVSERTKLLLNDPLFANIKADKPKALEKIVVIPGDITSTDLGITADDENILLEKVSVIIHSAATVKFNETLPDAWNMNVEGTRKVLALSRRMKRLELRDDRPQLIAPEHEHDVCSSHHPVQPYYREPDDPLHTPPSAGLLSEHDKLPTVFVHISTAYTNVKREVVHEILYPPPADINEVYQSVMKGVTEEQTKKILNGYPNIYTFTKALAEHLVAENQAYVPTVIVRPSIVAAVKEASNRGWLENWFGATSLVVLSASGLVRVGLGDGNNRLDLIPVDYVANLVIVAGARNTNVYNCCSSSCNPITIDKVVELFRVEITKNKSQTMPLPGWYMFTKYRWIVTLLTILFQIIPAYIADIYLQINGKSPRYMKLNSLGIQVRAALEYFTSHSWVMKAERVRELYASLSPADQLMFPCDPATIDWPDYIKDYYCGVLELQKRKIK